MPLKIKDSSRAKGTNGSGQIDNLVPQNSRTNRAGGEWYQMEQSWAEALEAGRRVDVNISPSYTGSSARPDAFNVEYYIDDELTILNILNEME